MLPLRLRSPSALTFHAIALVVALLCSAWAVFGGGAGRRMEWDRLPTTPSDDLYTHMEMLATAAEAQSLGWPQLMQVPRMAKTKSLEDGYPLFQFYSFLPFHLPALAVRAGAGPYHALLGAIFFSFVLGTWGMAGLARAQGFSDTSAWLCSAAYCLAPFHLTDLYGRVAYPELVAFGLMPCVFWSTWCLATRPSLGAGLLSSLSWACLVLSHNIFHLWAVPLMAAWLLAWQHLGKEALAARSVIGAYLVGLLMALFFFAPIVIIGREVSIANLPMLGGLNPLWVLFNPLFAHTDFVAFSSPQLGLQVGWPLLLPGLYCLWNGVRGPRLATLGLFALTLFLVWAPLEVWSFLGPWQIAQFPYRLLLFATLFGALLVAETFDEKLSFALGVGGVLVLIVWSLPWKQIVPGRSATAAEAQFQSEGMYFRNSLDYHIPRVRMQLAHPHDDLKTQPLPSNMRLWASKNFWYPWLYRAELKGRPIPYGYVNAYVAAIIPIDAEPPVLHYQGLPWANAISAWAIIAWLLAALVWVKKLGLR